MSLDYKYIGGWVASRKTGSAIFDLYPNWYHYFAVRLLKEICATPFSICGDMFSVRVTSEKNNRKKNDSSLLAEIQHLVFLHDVAYLKESTVLGELQAWIY